MNTLRISEIFYSIQGESTNAGLPCTFVRLQGCGLRCSWCDTPYGLDFDGEAEDLLLDEIIARTNAFGCRLVEITGGEPLEQEPVYELMTRLCDSGCSVMIETGGYKDISRIDARVKKIVDFKCPSSGMTKKNFFSNVGHLTSNDEVKFVIGSEEDYLWSKQIMRTYDLGARAVVLMSPVFGAITPLMLTEWILRDRLDVRMQLQMHKFIWPPDKRGV
ncbi:MAG TPA: radical SAM protein [Bacteroidota bacterium]|nr:radical SAM protein [Bacteroidota bacterium]